MKSGIGSSPHPAFPDGRPVEIGQRFLLAPEGAITADASGRRGDRIPIHLSRGRAFGSGLHETTLSCIESLEKIAPFGGLSVLDVGTGTGILSLAAVLLGSGNAVALDIDSDAVSCCRRNAVVNNVGSRIRVFRGTLDALNPLAVFDLVLANIHGDIILRETPRLVQHTGEGGHLILSGLDYTDNRPLKEAMRNWEMREIAVDFLEEFVTQIWHRPPRGGRREP